MKKTVQVLKDGLTAVAAAGLVVCVGISLIPKIHRKIREKYDEYPTA